jgi:heme-degrading monooxygenase HmoA
METTYTHTTWHAKPGREEEFVERWREWPGWSRREGFKAQALLLRDLDSPQTFVSFGPWESMAAVPKWRTLPGYEERVARLSEVVETFEPHTLEIAARQ